MVTDGAWAQIERLLHSALERPPHERAMFLRTECNDEEICREVESLLAASLLASGVFATSLPPTGTLATGMVLGNYRVEQSIGRGGMGEVYRARDTKLGRDVALKV